MRDYHVEVTTPEQSSLAAILGTFGAIAVGSFPGTDPVEPVRILKGETPRLPAVVELPGRGPGGDMIGRAMTMLAGVSADFAVETTTSGWRLAGRSTDAHNRVTKRANRWLDIDLEAAEEVYGQGSWVKFAIAGPWTLASYVEQRNGHRLVADPGAVADLIAAYHILIGEQVSRLRGLGFQPVLQLDEAVLNSVMSAQIPTPSGLHTYRAVAGDTIRQSMAGLVATAHDLQVPVLIHSCELPAPVELLRSSGADGLLLDLTSQTSNGTGGHEEEQLGALMEAGVILGAGIVPMLFPTAVHDPISTTGAMNRLLTLLDRLGLRLDTMASTIVPTTPCGLVGTSLVAAQRTMQTVAAVSEQLTKEIA